MKWIKKLLLVAPLMLLLISGTAYAKNNVSEIDISVTVRDDGSAYVVQNWQGTFEEGTENYIPIATKDIGISDLKVSDEKGEYTFVDDWDIDADFDAKKRKCGINKTDDGVELCFGITDYGENKYAIEYVVTDFIKSYSDYIDEVKGKKIVLPVGTYTISVKSNQSEEAGWEKPFYSGSKEITIQSGEITSVQIVCKISNTKVAVEYAGNLANYFSRYETTVSNTSGSLLYTRDETRAGFFKAEKLTADLRLVNLDGNEFTMQRVFPDIKEQYFYKIKYSLDDGGGNEEAGADFDGIIVDEKADTIYYGIFIKEEDLFGKSAPKLTLDGFTENKIVYKKADNPVVPEHSLTIEAPNGIKQLKVKTTSFQFADIPSFDLCNLTDAARTRLQQLGFPIQEVKDKQELTFVLTDFAKALDPASATQMATHTFTFSVLDNLHQETTVQFIYEIRPNVNVTTEEPVVWAKFVTLRGNSIDRDNIGFMFKKKADTDFQRYDATIYNEQTGDFSLLLIENIMPGTEYEYYAVSGTDAQGDVKTFTTSPIVNLKNNTFDEWFKNGKTWFPNVDVSKWWDSGNTGANTAGENNPTSPEESVVVKGKAAKLQSTWIGFIGIGAFASASMFTGNFVDIDGTNGILSFGQPFTAKPTKLTGYYKYTPVNIDYMEQWDSKVDPDLKSGDSDQCIIYIALCTKNYEIRTNPKSRQLFDPNDASVIAYGELVAKEAVSGEEANGYKKFSIDIKYRKTDVTPSYIVVVAAASRYGDYFTGGKGSTLYIDEFNLEYDYNAASFTNE